ncbi:MAG: NAD(P)-dependent oxidoreductase [Patescibacteria group bacterium]
MKRKNLVLGSSGVIGTSFCRFLSSLGEEVVPFDIQRDKKEDARFAKLPLDVVDRVYFFAWDVGGSKYLFREDSLIGQLEWNLKLLENVMQQLQASSVPFFFISSQFAEEYGTPYGATKRLGEIWTRLIPHGYFARQWNIYGTVENMNERSHVLGDFIHQALTTGEIHMLTNGKEMRQFVHIDDSMLAYHKIMNEKIKGGIYDITSSRWTSIREVADIVASLTGAKVIPGDKDGFSHIDLPAHDKILGWEAKIGLKEGVHLMVKNYRQTI